MARNPTTFSRVSTGYRDSKNTLGESGYDLGFTTGYGTSLTLATGIAGAAITGSTLALTSTLSANGAATFQSTVSSRAQGTFTGLLNRSNLTQTSNASFGGGVTVDSLATFNSGVTIKGGLTASVATAQDGIAVGTGGRLTNISTATAAVSLGAIAPLESSSLVTAALSGATRGDTIILTLDSIYARAAGNTDITWCVSSGSTVGEVSIWGINSTLTSVTPTASTVVRLTRIAHPTYL